MTAHIANISSVIELISFSEEKYFGDLGSYVVVFEVVVVVERGEKKMISFVSGLRRSRRKRSEV